MNYTEEPSIFVPRGNKGCASQFDSRNRRLIRIVQQNPILYNPLHPDYRNCAKKEEIWLEISKEFGCSPQMCRTRFKTMRDCYMRERRMRHLMNNDDNSKKRKSEDHRYINEFHFLDKIAKARMDDSPGDKNKAAKKPSTRTKKTAARNDDGNDSVFLVDSSSNGSTYDSDSGVQQPSALPAMPPLRMAPAAALYAAQKRQHATGPGYEVRTKPLPVYLGSNKALVTYASNLLDNITDEASSIRAKTKLFAVLQDIEQEYLGEKVSVKIDYD